MSGWQEVASSPSSTSSKTRLGGRSRSGISSDDRPPSRTVRLGRLQPQAPTHRTPSTATIAMPTSPLDSRWHYIGVGGSVIGWFVFIFIYSLIRENHSCVIYVIMSTFYFYLNLLLVPVAALLGDFIYHGIRRWFFPYNYPIVQEIHRHEADDSTREGPLYIVNRLTAEEARSFAITQLPRETSKHTGFARLAWL